MILGLCWPTDGPDGRLDANLLARIRGELPISHLRINLDHRNEHAGELVDQVRAVGLEPLPILDLDYAALKSGPQDGDEFAEALWPYIEFSVRAVETHRLETVEVLNEPNTLHGLPPELYARVANAVGDQLKRHGFQTRVVLAGDMLKASRWGPTPTGWWSDARAGLQSDLYEAVAIHPFRNPGSPDIASWRFLFSRSREFRWIAREALKPLWVTETGWNLSDRGFTEDQQAQYLVRELDLCKEAGAEAVLIYAYVSPRGTGFGLFDSEDWRARPAVQAIGAWSQQVTGSAPPARAATPTPRSMER
jgi:hypothetical protein